MQPRHTFGCVWLAGERCRCACKGAPSLPVVTGHVCVAPRGPLVPHASHRCWDHSGAAWQHLVTILEARRAAMPVVLVPVTAVCASCNGTTVLAPWASLDCRHATPPAPAATWQGPGSGRDKMGIIVPLGATFRAKPGCVVTTFWPVELDSLGRSTSAQLQMNGFGVVWDGPHQV